MDVDLEAVQVLGAADSFLPTNEPEYSGILMEDPAVLAEYFTKACQEVSQPKLVKIIVYSFRHILQGNLRLLRPWSAVKTMQDSWISLIWSLVNRLTDLLFLSGVLITRKSTVSVI